MIATFDLEKFRELTKRVISKEKYGFYNDWSDEQRKIYDSGDWESFSRSRGYSEEDIVEFKEWLKVIEENDNALSLIEDLTVEASLANIQKNVNNDILKSSHIPRSSILKVEDNIRHMEGSMEGDCFPLKHSFGKDCYVREISVPKGNFIVTKTHKVDHPCFVLSGECSVLTEQGVNKVKGPCHFITKAGTKRIVYVHEDTVWVTVHATKSKDLKKIEKQVILQDKPKLLGGVKMFKKLIGLINKGLMPNYRSAKGSWVAIAMAGSAAVGAGTSIYSGSQNRKAQEKLTDEQNARQDEMNKATFRPEPKEATSLLFEKLQEFGGQDGYGAISPDWADIWQTSQQRIRDYYSGTATQPGALSKIRASAARRNVSDSPALDTEITKALVEQGGQIQTAASQQALAQSQFSEQGRQDWLQRLLQVAGIGTGYNAPPQPMMAPSSGVGEAVGMVGQGVGAIAQYKGQEAWLDKLMASQGGGGGGVNIGAAGGSPYTA